MILETTNISDSSNYKKLLEKPVQYLKGVGPKMAAILKRQGILKVEDALWLFPRTYEDRRKPTTIKDAKLGETILFIGTIGKFRTIYLRGRRKTMIESSVSDDTGRLGLKWFYGRMDYFQKSFPEGSRVLFRGTVSNFGSQHVIIHPDMQPIDLATSFSPQIVPVYTEHEGLNQRRIRSMVRQTLPAINQIVDPLPEEMRTRLKLPNLQESLRQIHSPEAEDNFTDLHEWKTPAQQRILFDELFYFELYLMMNRHKRQKEKGISFTIKNRLSEELRQSLPFTLTNGQEMAIAEIYDDMQSPYPMHRLLQGDVGSGKTLVAFFSALLAIENGYQVALMAPTEILAEQHFNTASKFLRPLGINLGLLLSRQTERDKKLTKQEINSGATQCVIGTHALFQEKVEFKNLGLAIIDEQHRFGVKQRLSLRKKGNAPDMLVMTATPIPRTMALTLYGDLDISTIRELPPGRQPITTKIVTDKQLPDMHKFIGLQMEEGAQVYVVLPLIQESEKVDLKNAVDMAEQLKNLFPNKNIGLLHGNLPSEEKQKVMNQFIKNEIQLLVSTTVVEVGVDVANASVMVIEHAERFGLSQLHQLRGRIGRGTRKSFCFLSTNGKYFNKKVEAFETTRRRLEVMARTTDGFVIAEEDLKIRGPGELLGTKQAGLPTFRYADLIRDTKILNTAREEAFQIVKTDPDLKQPEHSLLKKKWDRLCELVSAS